MRTAREAIREALPPIEVSALSTSTLSTANSEGPPVGGPSGYMVETEGNRTPRPEQFSSRPTTGLVGSLVSPSGPLPTGSRNASPLVLGTP